MSFLDQLKRKREAAGQAPAGPVSKDPAEMTEAELAAEYVHIQPDDRRL